MDKWIKNNTAMKLVALAVSMLLWAMVHMDSGTPAPPTTSYDTKSIDVKIQTYGFDDSKYALTGINVDEVRLVVKARAAYITSFFSDDFKAKLDLSSITEPGTYTLPLTADYPSSVELVSMNPSSVTVTVEQLVSKSVSVSVGTKGEAAEDYRAGTPVTVDPETVTVTLPESELARLSQVRATVDLDGTDENIVEKRVKLTAYDTEGVVLEDAVIEPSTVTVQIPIEPAFVKVPLEVEYTGRLPEGLVLSKVVQKVKEVKLFGSNEVLAGAETYTGATINLANVTQSGTTVLTADLTPPAGFEKIEPSYIEVEITAVSYGERAISGIPIKLEGVPAGLKAEITDPASKTMSLTLTGAPDLLNDLEPADIGLTANAAGLRAGVHEIPLQVTLPDLISRVDQTRLTVKVDITEPDKPVTSTPDEIPEQPESEVEPSEPSEEPPSSGTEQEDSTNNGSSGPAETPPAAEEVEREDTSAPSGHSDSANP